MLFGKNSDRQRNEAQTVEYFPRAANEPDSWLSCTYISIPQVQRTHAVLLCRPFWIWGAEMGANEHGVAIGNEGLYARAAAPEDKALTGMDLVRLALERATTAAEAVEVITMLLERYGQGGNCGHLIPSYYNNGFVVADAKEAFVLETIGKEWLVERLSSVRAMSNTYSIGRGVQRVSEGLPRLLRDIGWSAGSEANYAETLADSSKEHIGNAGARQACSTSLLRSRNGRLSAIDLMNILRDHGSGDFQHPEYRAECSVKRTVCMHAGGDDRGGQTVGSMVSELHHAGVVHWVTGTAAPCTSIFKPVLVDVPVAAHGPRLTDRFDGGTLWWRHERLHRAAILGDFAKFLDNIRDERNAMERDFHDRVKAALSGGSAADRAQVVAECWKEAMETEERWVTHIKAAPPSDDTGYVSSWTKMNRLAGIEPYTNPS